MEKQPCGWLVTNEIISLDEVIKILNERNDVYKIIMEVSSKEELIKFAEEHLCHVFDKYQEVLMCLKYKEKLMCRILRRVPQDMFIKHVLVAFEFY